MSKFVFTVKNEDGSKQSGFVTADNYNAAMKTLAQKNLVVIRMTQVRAIPKNLRVSDEYLLTFTQELATMTKAGLMLGKALEVIASDIDNENMRQITTDISTGLSEGKPMSEILAMYPRVFSKLYVSMVEAGEKSGKLPLILARMAKHLENTINLKKRLQAQLYYPVVVVVFATIVFTLMFTFGIPIVSDIYRQLGAELPTITKMFINTGVAIHNNMTLIFIAIGVLVVAGYVLANTQQGRYFLHGLVFRLPLIGPIVRKMIIARFARTFSTLYASGVPILESMQLIAGSMGNLVMEKIILDSIQNLSEGESITKALGESKIFTPIAMSIISVGEETGALSEMLDELGEFYETHVDIALRGLTQLLEPLIMIFIGVGIGVVLVTLALPFMNLFSSINT